MLLMWYYLFAYDFYGFAFKMMCARKDHGFMVLQNSFPHCKWSRAKCFKILLFASCFLFLSLIGFFFHAYLRVINSCGLDGIYLHQVWNAFIECIFMLSWTCHYGEGMVGIQLQISLFNEIPISRCNFTLWYTNQTVVVKWLNLSYSNCLNFWDNQ